MGYQFHNPAESWTPQVGPGGLFWAIFCAQEAKIAQNRPMEEGGIPTERFSFSKKGAIQQQEQVLLITAMAVFEGLFHEERDLYLPSPPPLVCTGLGGVLGHSAH